MWYRHSPLISYIAGKKALCSINVPKVDVDLNIDVGDVNLDVDLSIVERAKESKFLQETNGFLFTTKYSYVITRYEASRDMYVRIGVSV